jgi:hypothetical protein
MRRQLTVQAQKNAAIQDAEVWLAEATTHDLEAFLNKDLRDDYRQVFAKIKASIENGAKELTLKWSGVSHRPEAVLRHFSNFNFENLSPLTSLKIPAPIHAEGTQKHQREIIIFRCRRLTELSVADTHHACVHVVAALAEHPQSRVKAQNNLLIRCVVGAALKKIDLSGTAATALDLLVAQEGVFMAAPPKLLTCRGIVTNDFDPEGQIFLRMLNNQADPLDPESSIDLTAPYDSRPISTLIPAGLVQLAQVSILMHGFTDEIKYEAKRLKVPTLCLQQACLLDIFGPVLRRHWGPTAWLDGQNRLRMLKPRCGS